MSRVKRKGCADETDGKGQRYFWQEKRQSLYCGRGKQGLQKSKCDSAGKQQQIEVIV